MFQIMAESWILMPRYQFINWYKEELFYPAFTQAMNSQMNYKGPSKLSIKLPQFIHECLFGRLELTLTAEQDIQNILQW